MRVVSSNVAGEQRYRWEMAPAGCGETVVACRKPNGPVVWTTEDEYPAGCSKRLSGKAAASEGPKAYPLGYVEGLNDVRTPLADFFSILLGNDVAHKIVQGRIGDFDLDEFPCCG